MLVAATSEGREVAGRLAVKTGSGVLTDATGVSDGMVAEQSIFGGAITVQSRVRTGTPDHRGPAERGHARARGRSG